MRLSEDQIIEQIRRRVPSSNNRWLVRGIGDDSAVLQPGRFNWILTCDQFLEDSHFLADVHPPDSVGYKALVRATSDIVAMGASPRIFLLSIALPAERTGRWLSQMLGGMARGAKLLGLTLAGGDTARSPDRGRRAGAISLNLMVMGEARYGPAIYRTGARPGDGIFVTGQLGGAQLGLEILLKGMHRNAVFRKLLKPHLYPELALRCSAWLARKRLASSMMDISDGLSTDLARLCHASGVGACIFEGSLPTVEIPTEARKLGFHETFLALNGGDDYGLLFTVPRRWDARIPQKLGGAMITRIGEITRSRRLKLVSKVGKRSSLAPGGWDHFRRALSSSGRVRIDG